MAKKRILKVEVEMTENTSRIFTETMLWLYEKYKDKIDLTHKRDISSNEIEEKIQSNK